MLPLGLLLLAASCAPDTSATLQSAARARIARDSGAVVAVVLQDPVSGLTLALNPDLRFHAASTMKLGVLRRIPERARGAALHADLARLVHAAVLLARK